MNENRTPEEQKLAQEIADFTVQTRSVSSAQLAVHLIEIGYALATPAQLTEEYRRELLTICLEVAYEAGQNNRPFDFKKRAIGISRDLKLPAQPKSGELSKDDCVEMAKTVKPWKSKQPCPKCNGTGLYLDPNGRTAGDCPLCKPYPHELAQPEKEGEIKNWIRDNPGKAWRMICDVRQEILKDPKSKIPFITTKSVEKTSQDCMEKAELIRFGSGSLSRPVTDNVENYTTGYSRGYKSGFKDAQSKPDVEAIKEIIRKNTFKVSIEATDAIPLIYPDVDKAAQEIAKL